MTRPGWAAAVLLVLGAAQPAQPAPAPRPTPGTTQPVGPVPLPPVPPATFEAAPALPPYQAKLDRLAELMGTLAYLRDLCGKGDGATWHARMDDLLAAEGGESGRRERLAGSFNKGYTGYQLTYRACTPTAEVVMRRATREGVRIAADVEGRFGTP